MNPTDQECAAVDFEPWPPAQPGDTEIDLSGEGFSAMGVAARMALAVMERTKEELVEMFHTTDRDAIDQMMRCFEGTAGQLQQLAKMIDGAHARMQVAAVASRNVS